VQEVSVAQWGALRALRVLPGVTAAQVQHLVQVQVVVVPQGHRARVIMVPPLVQEM